MVVLVSSDGEQFIVDQEVLEHSTVIMNTLEDRSMCFLAAPLPVDLISHIGAEEIDQPITLAQVSSPVLKKGRLLSRCTSGGATSQINLVDRLGFGVL
jgi:hypothetical protein